MVTAVLYARQSRTDDPSRSASLDAQEAELLALADRRGWIVAGVYRDPDAPADALDRRAAWVDLLDHCDHHVVDVVAAFDASRLWRSVEMQLATCKHLTAAGVATIATLAGETSTNPQDNPESGFMATVLAATSQLDNQLRSLKLRKAAEQAARDGTPAFGGNRPYGYADDRVTLVEEEAAVVRDAARRVLAGESVGAICNDLTARGVPTVSGGPWRTTTLRRLLTSPRSAGLRSHKGEVVGDAVWPPLLDRDIWNRVRDELLDARRRKGGRPHVWLLTGGTAVCGRCSAPLVSAHRAAGPVYACRRDAARGYSGCGRLGVVAGALDAEIRDRVAARLDGDGLRNALAELNRDDRGGLVAELRNAERDLEDLEVAHFVDKHLSRGGYLRARARHQARVDELRAALSATDHSRVLVEVAASSEGVRATWDARDVPWRRLLVAALIHKVTVAPTGRGPNRFNGNRVRVDWRA